MAWKSREGKQPPTNFYAQIMAYLAQAYPDAAISQSAVSQLKPAWDALWLDGRTAEIAAKTTCSCDGKRITPSPVLAVPRLPRGVVRGPTGLERGQLFEPSQIRGSVAVEQLKRKSTSLSKQIERLLGQAGKIGTRAAKAGTERSRLPLEQEYAKRRAAIQEKITAAIAIQTQIKALQSQLGEVARLLAAEEAAPAQNLPDLPAFVPKQATPKAAKAAKVPKPAQPAKAPKPTKAAPAKAAKAPKSAKAAESANPADAAILAAIQAALPSVAAKLKESLTKK